MNTAIRFRTTALALCLAAAASPVSAADALPTRAVTALGIAIAMQGDMALIEIREELKRNLLETLKPLLPPPPKRDDKPSTVTVQN